MLVNYYEYMSVFTNCEVLTEVLLEDWGLLKPYALYVITEP